MTRYRVEAYTTISFTTEVDIDDEGMDEGEAEEAAYDKAMEKRRGLCAQCSGYGRDWSLDMNDDWDIGEIEKI